MEDEPLWHVTLGKVRLVKSWISGTVLLRVAKRTFVIQGAPWEVWQTVSANSTWKNKKNVMSSYLPFLELKGILALEISKFTKIRKFQKNLYANLRLLNDYGLIISSKRNKKVYMWVCFIFKIRDATSTRICFFILMRALKSESRSTCLQRSNFKYIAYARISFSVHLSRINKKAYVCICFTSNIGDATSVQICFSISMRTLKWESRFVRLLRLGDKVYPYLSFFKYFYLTRLRSLL